MQNTEENRKKISELIKDARVGMLTTMSAEGKHLARPMWLQETDFDGNLWFFSQEHSDKAVDIENEPQVNVSFSDQKHNAWVSISGTAHISKDKDKMRELWNPAMKAWFPDELETEGICLICVRADTAEYWDSPNSKVVTLIGMAKAAVTGKPAKGGENETVRL